MTIGQQEQEFRDPSERLSLNSGKLEAPFPLRGVRGAVVRAKKPVHQLSLTTQPDKIFFIEFTKCVSTYMAFTPSFSSRLGNYRNIGSYRATRLQEKSRNVVLFFFVFISYMQQKNGCKRTIQKASFEKEVYVFYLSVSSVLKPEIFGDVKQRASKNNLFSFGNIGGFIEIFISLF